MHSLDIRTYDWYIYICFDVIIVALSCAVVRYSTVGRFLPPKGEAELGGGGQRNKLNNEKRAITPTRYIEYFVNPFPPTLSLSW